MFSHLKRAGCGMQDTQVECRRCDGQLAGGFQDDGNIVLCANHIRTQDHANTTLVHETIHAFDQCRAKVDWSNCLHHACSEIRAAALSGDCAFGREVLLRRNFGFSKQFQRCIQRRAEISVGMNPNCDALAVSPRKTGAQIVYKPLELDGTPKPTNEHPFRIIFYLQAKLAVQGAWDACYNDSAPFDRIP
jgi:mitochondrial inner membrane protease ATP23